ncbi:hypothetical protein Btru_066358 [Bulinus truncatus]|nr:hypothetical protein Btru_066358 [Bulinus truncatus]
MTLYFTFNSEMASKILSIVLVVIAIDRYRKICKPTKRQITLKTCRLSLVTVVGGSLLFSWPATILYGIRSVDTGIINITGSDSTFQDTLKDPMIPSLYNSALFLGLTFEVIVIVFYQTPCEDQAIELRVKPTGISLPGSRAMKGHLNKKVRGHKTMTTRTTLIAPLLTTVYIVSYLPYLCLQVMKFDNNMDDRQGPVVLYNIIIRSFFMSSVSNPVIYEALSPVTETIYTIASPAIQLALFIVGNVLQTFVILTGSLGNIINIVVFLKMGLTDSLSLCFFVLSCSDLLSLTLLFALRYAKDFPLFLSSDMRVDRMALVFIIVYYYLLLYDVSQMVTSYIAVQKCCCVALPFIFKSTFTRVRSCLVLASIVILALAMYIPIFTAQGIHRQRDVGDNSTLLTLWTTASRPDIILVVNFWGIFLPTLCQIVILCCLVILASTLRKSSQFHKLMSGHVETRDNTQRQPTRNSKEMQAVYATSLVSLVYVICNTPRLVISYVSLIEPEFNVLRTYSDLYVMFNIFRNTIEAVNTSVNILVFIMFNTRYRKTLFPYRCLR